MATTTTPPPKEEEEAPQSLMFKYVYIPADPLKSMRELEHPMNATLEDDQLRETVRLHFAAASSLTSSQLDAYIKSLRKQAQEKEPSMTFDDETLKRMALAVSVDTYPLTVPTKFSPEAVSMYCDEKGQAKNLRLNARAIGLAAATGATQQEFRGDCFVSRYFDDDNAWLRRDFLLSDCRSDAAWIVAAKNRPSRHVGAMHQLYQQLGGGSSSNTNQQEPVKIDTRDVTRRAMEAEHETETYSWSQTAEEIEIRLKVPADIVKSKVRVVLRRTALTVDLLPDKPRYLHLEPLFDAVDADAGANWTLEKKSNTDTEEGNPPHAILVLTLDRAGNSTPWPALTK